MDIFVLAAHASLPSLIGAPRRKDTKAVYPNETNAANGTRNAIGMQEKLIRLAGIHTTQHALTSDSQTSRHRRSETSAERRSPKPLNT